MYGLVFRPVVHIVIKMAKSFQIVGLSPVYSYRSRTMKRDVVGGDIQELL